MNSPNNARSTASKNKIMSAFQHLLESKEYSAISVQEVCKQAGVNRTTFYAHYSNISELLEAMEVELLSKAGSQILPSDTDAFRLASRDTMLKMLQFIRQNRLVYRYYFSQTSASKLLTDFLDNIKKTYIIPTLSRSSVYSTCEYDYQFEFCREGSMGIVKAWLATGCSQSDEDIAGLIEKMLRRCLP